MPICAACGKDKPWGKPKAYHTGRILGKTEHRTGQFVQTTTSYGDFREHDYFVCSTCRFLFDLIARPLALIAAIAVPIILIVVAIKAHQAWLFAAALVLFIVDMAPAAHLSTDAKLGKKALGERGEKPRGIHAFFFTGETEQFKAFDEREYEALRAKNALRS